MSVLTESENRFLSHMSMWGSAGYPVRKVGTGRWIWDEFHGVKGAPVVYRTKRDCVDAIETYIGVLCDKSAGRI
jgi:hypothetical protein